MNSVNAARASAGFSCDRIEVLSPRLTMTTSPRLLRPGDRCRREPRRPPRYHRAQSARRRRGRYHDRHRHGCGRAGGVFRGARPRERQRPSDGDAVSETINPFGGIEALLTHCLSTLFDIPTAHAPMYDSVEIMNSDVGYYEPRKAAEAVSVSFLHCVLKGLSRAPAIVTDPGAVRRIAA